MERKTHGNDAFLWQILERGARTYSGKPSENSTFLKFVNKNTTMPSNKQKDWL